MLPASPSSIAINVTRFIALFFGVFQFMREMQNGE